MVIVYKDIPMIFMVVIIACVYCQPQKLPKNETTTVIPTTTEPPNVKPSVENTTKSTTTSNEKDKLQHSSSNEKDKLQHSSSTRTETTIDIILEQGYPAEVHQVVTEDGYILELHRIPHGRQKPAQCHKRSVVFLQHCLLCSSSDWVINSPDKAIGFILADSGYDVWIGNARGNSYSKRHQTLSNTSKKFWSFSWDEIALYDIPASIDFALNATNSTELNYVGFSMGTLVLFAMMSEKPHYNEKVKLMIAMGPVAFLNNMEGPLSLLTRLSGTFKFFTDLLGIYEVLPGGLVLDLVTSIFCDPLVTSVAPICDNILLSLIGLDTNHLNKRLLPKFLSHTPAGTSVQNMVHFMQAKNSGRFQKFSYGPSGNKKVYNSKFPPTYNINATTIPVALFWGQNDWYANPRDVTKLAKLLPNVIFKKQVTEKYFSHVDFLWSDSAVDLVYGDMLRLLREYNQFDKAV